MTTRTVTHLAELGTLEPEWRRIQAKGAPDSVFLTWEWCHAWARHYVPDGDLRVIVAQDDKGTVTGIAPLYRTRTDGRPRARELRLLGTGEACACYLDLIVAPGHRATFTGQLYDVLYGPGNGWDVLTLGDVAAESSLVDEWSARFGEAGKVLDLAGQSVCPVIHLPATVEAFRAGLSRNARYNLKRKERWLEEEGKVDFHLGGLGADDPHGMTTLARLHQGRWRAKEGPGAFSSARFRAFHREVAAVFAERGWLEVDFLLLDGEPIAGIYGFTHGGCYYYYLPGLDPARASRSSPGMHLLVHIVERAIQRGCTRVDLLKGAAGYKATLANGVRRCLTLRAYRRGPRALLYKGVQGARDLAKVLLR